MHISGQIVIKLCCFWIVSNLILPFLKNNMQETSPSVVFIEVLELLNSSNNSKEALLADGSNAKVEGTGSGFLWDKFGHIVGTFVLSSSIIFTLPDIHRSA